MQRVLLSISAELKAATEREQLSAARVLPVGLGALSASILDKEIGDYTRFNNRREVASFTGLCPGEHSSSSRRIQGSINKHGNPRVRHILLEAVWRLFYFQPNYKPILKWKQRFAKEPFTAARKKKMAVAIAREFAVDWWRMQTGRATPDNLGLTTGLPAGGALIQWRKAQCDMAINN